MVKPITVLVGLLLATSAGAQSRLYTNADVGRPLSPNRPSVTAEQLAGLQTHQFRLPVDAWGPQVVILDSQVTDGPFGAFAPFSPSHVAPGGAYFETVGPAYYGGYGYGLGYGYGYPVGRGLSRSASRAHVRPSIPAARQTATPRMIPTPRPSGSLGGIRVPRQY